jgi:hypothetical protein
MNTCSLASDWCPRWLRHWGAVSALGPRATGASRDSGALVRCHPGIPPEMASISPCGDRRPNRAPKSICDNMFSNRQAVAPARYWRYISAWTAFHPNARRRIRTSGSPQPPSGGFRALAGTTPSTRWKPTRPDRPGPPPPARWGRSSRPRHGAFALRKHVLPRGECRQDP